MFSLHSLNIFHFHSNYNIYLLKNRLCKKKKIPKSVQGNIDVKSLVDYYRYIIARSVWYLLKTLPEKHIGRTK